LCPSSWPCGLKSVCRHSSYPREWLLSPLPAPWSAVRRTCVEVGQFFADLSAHAEPEAFEVFAVTAQGDRVVLEGRNRGRARSTGRSYEHDWVMVLTVQDGLIVRARHYYDTADVLAALV
jgi:hypothetical protein